ncbi:MAG: SRPBCC family protein [Actinomycetota bacterium]
MELSDSFTIDRPIDDAWALLCEPERVARCVPGAHLTEVVGDDHRGVVNVRLGVLAARFTGHATFEHDLDRHRIIVKAKGDGNQGQADAHITARLEALSDDQTQVNVDSDLQLEGRLAQLGRGIIIEVSSALTAQFADNLAASATAEHVLGTSAFDQPRGITMPEPEALDLLDTARRPIMKRLVPLAGLIAAIAWLVRGRRSRP